MTTLHLPSNQSQDWITRMVNHADAGTRIYYGQSYIKSGDFYYTQPPARVMDHVRDLSDNRKVTMHSSRREDGIDGFDYFCIVRGEQVWVRRRQYGLHHTTKNTILALIAHPNRI